MNDIVGVMKKVAAHEARRIYTTELGIVTEAFPHAEDSDNDNYACSVKLLNRKQPDGSDFVLKKVPVAAPYMGWACVPNKDDMVLLQFIGGDLNAPVITGRLYNDALRPPVNKPGELVVRHKADGKVTIKIDEKSKITVSSANEKNVVTIEDDQIALVGDKYSIVVDVKNEKISITSDKDLEFLATQGKCLIDVKELEIKTSGKGTIDAKELEIKTSGKGSIDVKELEIKSSGKGSIDVKDLAIKSSGSAKLEAQGELTVKGSTVQAEASGPFKIKGAMIDMN